MNIPLRMAVLEQRIVNISFIELTLSSLLLFLKEPLILIQGPSLVSKQ